MKYMGSKRAMLQNGLGDLLSREVLDAPRFVDLFAGSGSVAIHVARKFSIPVLAFDLQSYSTVLTSAVIDRRTTLLWQPVWEDWLRRAAGQFKAHRIPMTNKITQPVVAEFRAWCNEQLELPITKAYGGHYFSPQQAVWIDALRTNLPSRKPANTVALAALIQAASQCAAAPGHTAQPFQPTRTAKRYIEEAWRKDIVEKTKSAFELLANQFAQRHGKAKVGDANQVARRLHEGDLVFIDPPYSGVQYSRFYHVLEIIADGDCGVVTGVGRYPAWEFRPRSNYSLISESSKALDNLLKTVASRGARAILTFPDHDCSNGLSGDSVREIAAKHFQITSQKVASRFSTLGGTGDSERSNETARSARKDTHELMLVLKPR
jgi:adenine-specific DNA-methyltransferase